MGMGITNIRCGDPGAQIVRLADAETMRTNFKGASRSFRDPFAFFDPFFVEAASMAGTTRTAGTATTTARPERS